MIAQYPRHGADFTYNLLIIWADFHAQKRSDNPIQILIYPFLNMKIDL